MLDGFTKVHVAMLIAVSLFTWRFGVPFFIDATKLLRLYVLGFSYKKVVAKIKSIRKVELGYTVEVVYDGMTGIIDYLSDDPNFSARVNEDVIAYYAMGSKKLLAIDFPAASAGFNQERVQYNGQSSYVSGLDLGFSPMSNMAGHHQSGTVSVDISPDGNPHFGIQPNAVFKVTELSPRFEQKPNTYAITGEVIGGGFTGKTFTVEKIIPQQFLQHVGPGMVIPCHVDSSSSETKIIFSIHA